MKARYSEVFDAGCGTGLLGPLFRDISGDLFRFGIRNRVFSASCFSATARGRSGFACRRAALACSRIRSFSLSVSLPLARWMSPSVSRARSACFGVDPARLLGVVRPWFGVLVRIFGVLRNTASVCVAARRSTRLRLPLLLCRWPCWSCRQVGSTPLADCFSFPPTYPLSALLLLGLPQTP